MIKRKIFPEFPLRVTGSLLSPAGKNARLSILLYHRVLSVPDPLFPAEVDAARFDAQMQLLAGIFNILPLTEAVEGLKSGSLPARAACMTFDDGYADNVEIALPILKKHHIPATFFIATGYLDGGMMFNDCIIESIRMAQGNSIELTMLELEKFPLNTINQRREVIDIILARLKHLPPEKRKNMVEAISDLTSVELPKDLMMRSEQVRLLSDSGMEIGGHTVYHPILASIDRQTAKNEIMNGKAYLESLTGKQIRTFAYPNGQPQTDYHAAHVKIVKELGFDAAVSTSWGVATQGGDLFQLPRFTPWDVSITRFALRMLGNLSRTNPVTVLIDSRR